MRGETSPGDQAVNRGPNLLFCISQFKIQMGVKNKVKLPVVLESEIVSTVRLCVIHFQIFFFF